MSKVHENAGKLALIQGNKKLADRDFAEAAILLTTAIAQYVQGDAAEVKANLEIAYLNLSTALISNNKPDEAIDTLNEAGVKGFASDKIDQNFAAAYRNLGIQQKLDGKLDDAIASFKEAKKYASEDAKTLYDLAVNLLDNKAYADAEAEFTALNAKGFSEVQFPLPLQLNAMCKLIECQAGQNKDIEPTLETASKVFDSISPVDQAAHKSEAEFIYSRLVKSFLVKGQHDNATDTLEALETNIVGITDSIISSLEKYSLYLYNSDQEGAMKLLFGLGVVEPSLVASVNSNLESMAMDSHKVGAEAFAEKALAGGCAFADIEGLFVV